MSRIAKKKITIPASVDVSIESSINTGTGQKIKAKGKLGQGEILVHPLVSVSQEENELCIKALEESKDVIAKSGTFRSLINNLVVGVSQGFTKSLQLVGVGYRAQVKGSVINLNLGFSHPIAFDLPEGVSAETPSQTEIVLKSADKQLLGQTAANIRSYRKPEPYKGKGIRYSDEQVKRKEAKKK